MDELPQVDEDEVQQFEEARAKKIETKQKRVMNGGPDQLPPDSEGADQGSTMTLEEREQRWGFSLSELHAATKVVSILVKNPQLYIGDPYLTESRLYTMLSRDRNIKIEHQETYSVIMKQEKRLKERQQRQQDLSKIQRTGMKKERDSALQQLLLTTNATELPPEESDDVPTVEEAAEDREMNRAQSCHICKSKYHTLHSYYYSLCPPCGDINFTKRSQTRDLRGKTVFLTGARIKIGYAIALSVLRCGAELVGTTRFVHDCLNRFQQEADYDTFKDRLHLFALDMRDLWMVTQFCEFLLKTFPKIFLIMNNAAQTIQRTPEYTEALRKTEASPPKHLKDSVEGSPLTAEWLRFFTSHSSVRVGENLKLEYHPTECGVSGTTTTTDGTCTTMLSAPKYDRYDTFQEALDVRHKNSWTTKLAEVQGSEAAEVMAINALAPFILNSKLKPALIAAGGGFIINVSAMEGMFYRHKLTTHPQTNMAKAALNMMTRTSGADYAESGIYMNSVDTGWITDESPLPKKTQRLEQNMLCPLDEIDAAARCLDLVYTDSKEFGKFWKDYREIPW
jgi:NAD(P)-dependent dehydrogenase (short-subunit alcohol dehydrogenase family)